MITPCSVWISCRVGAMRVKMLRRLICMVSRLSGGRKNSTFSSSRSSEAKKASSCSFGAGADFSGMANGSLPPVASLEPFIGDDHHRLRQIERGEGRIDRQGENAVGKRDFVVFQPVALAAEDDGDVFAGGDARRHQRRGLGGADDRLGLIVGARGRGERRRCSRRSLRAGCRKARRASRMRSAPAAIMRALSFGQDCRGATRRSRDRPKFAMARAAAPIFSAKLRLDQHDDRRRLCRPVLGVVGPGSGHCILAIANAPRIRQTRAISRNVGFLAASRADAIATPPAPRGRGATSRARPLPSSPRPGCKGPYSHGENQGGQSGRRNGRRRDDPDHLARDQGQADPPVSRHRPDVFRSRHPEARRDPRPDHHRRRGSDQEGRRRRSNARPSRPTKRG